MKQGSHIMLQRLVRSTVSTAPRPWRTVLEPWWCRSSSLCAGNVAAGEVLLDPFEELRVDGHQVFVLAVDGAFFHHPDLAVALDDLRLDLADLLVDQVGPVLLAVHDGVARFLHAVGAERVRRARPAERGLGLLPGLQQRLIGPFRREGWIGIVLVEELNRVERHACRLAERPVKGFPELVAGCVRHTCTSPQ